MAIIALCAYCTEENGKLEYFKQTLESLIATVDFRKNRLWITNNSTYQPASDYILEFKRDCDCEGLNTTIHFSDTNLGTAGGINLAIRERKPGEIVIKCDDDWTTEHKGWVDELEAMIKKRPEIGILGLKRDDVTGEFIKEGKLLWSHDIFGTCTAYNSAMLDRCGYLSQPSEYGFDDCIISVRSEAAGFKNAFLPHIKITNLDLVETEYTRWKRREAADYIQEAEIMMDMIRKGKLTYYYNPFE